MLFWINGVYVPFQMNVQLTKHSVDHCTACVRHSVLLKCLNASPKSYSIFRRSTIAPHILSILAASAQRSNQLYTLNA